MYESDRGIEELLRRLGPPNGSDEDSDWEEDAGSLDETTGPTVETELSEAPPSDYSGHDPGTAQGNSGTAQRNDSAPSYSIGVEWLAEQMRLFVDLHPDWEDAVGSLASYLARADDSDD